VSREKPKNRFGFSFKNRTVQKFDIRSDSFLTETACNPQFKLKLTEISTGSQCADKVRCKKFKTTTAEVSQIHATFPGKLFC